MCRVARKLTGSTSRMVPCCSGSGTNPITLSCTISLSAARKWGCDIMTGAPGTGIYSTLISSFSHTFKQRHLNLPNGFFLNPWMLYMQCQQKKKIKFGLKLRVGVVFFYVFYTIHKLVIKNEIGRCWSILEKSNTVDYHKSLLQYRKLLGNVQVNVFINIKYLSTQVSCFVILQVLCSLNGFQCSYHKIGIHALIRYTCTDWALKVKIQNITYIFN